MDEKVLKEVTYERNGSGIFSIKQSIILIVIKTSKILVYPFPLNHFQNWRYLFDYLLTYI